MATVPTPATMVAGTAPTAANLNTFRDAGNWHLTNKPLAMLVQQATQSLTTSVWGAITFGASSEELDRDGGHSTSSNTSRYTAATAGWYRFSGGVEFAGNSTGHRDVCFTKNGTAPTTAGAPRGFASAFPSSATQCGVCAGSALFSLNGSTDYVELWGLQTSGGALATSLTLGGPWMAVEWVGTA